MKLVARSTATVDHPAEQVYALVSNMERFGEWFPSVISIVSTNNLAHGQPGKAYLETVQVPLRGRRKVEITVVEALANRRFVTEGRFAPLLPRVEITLSEPGLGRTFVEWAMFSRGRHWSAGLLLPLARRTMQARADRGLKALKTHLGSQRSSA